MTTAHPPFSAEDLEALLPHRLGAESLVRYLRRHRLTPQHARGQNFLVDGEVLEAIVAASAPRPGTRVLEIGPGLGVLSEALARAGAEVTAVEVDPRLVAHLEHRLTDRTQAWPAGGSIRVIHGDVLDVPLEELIEPPYILAANLPYHITSPVLHRVLGGDRRPERFTLMLQREVAERIAAPPGAMSYLSVFVQYHARVSVIRIVSRDAFEPVPGVDSAILVGVVQPRVLDDSREEDLWRLVQAGFRERRKMLHNVLPRQLPILGRERIDHALAAVGITPDRRPQTLSVGEWLALAEHLGPLP